MPEITGRKIGAATTKTRKSKQIKHIRRSGRKGARWSKPSKRKGVHIVGALKKKGSNRGETKKKDMDSLQRLIVSCLKPGTALNRREGETKLETIPEESK